MKKKCSMQFESSSYFSLFHSFDKCYAAAKPVILEPTMLVELKVPTEFQGPVTGDINKYVLYENQLRHSEILFCPFWHIRIKFT